MSDEQPLRQEDHGTVRVLTLHRPEKKNALTPELAGALWDAVEDADAEDAVGAVVVTGAGDAYCGGVDVHVFQRIARGEMAGLQKLEKLHEALRACKKPLVAAVNGQAVGMGVTLLPCFDLVYAADTATFLTPFVRLGLVLEYGSSHTLPRLIGRQRANELTMRPHPIDAATAERWGLVTRVFPAAEHLERTLELVGDIAAQPPGAVAETKRLIHEGEAGTSFAEAVARENTVLRERYGSPENLAAVEAFLASRKARKS